MKGWVEDVHATRKQVISCGKDVGGWEMWGMKYLEQRVQNYCGLC